MWRLRQVEPIRIPWSSGIVIVIADLYRQLRVYPVMSMPIEAKLNHMIMIMLLASLPVPMIIATAPGCLAFDHVMLMFHSACAHTVCTSHFTIIGIRN